MKQHLFLLIFSIFDYLEFKRNVGDMNLYFPFVKWFQFGQAITESYAWMIILFMQYRNEGWKMSDHSTVAIRFKK